MMGICNHGAIELNVTRKEEKKSLELQIFGLNYSNFLRISILGISENGCCG